MEITYEVTEDTLEFYRDFGGMRMQVAGINLDTHKMFILKGDDHFDRLHFDGLESLASFEGALNKRFKTRLKIGKLLAVAIKQRTMIGVKANLDRLIIKEALEKGSKLTEAQIYSLQWHIQKDVGGFAENATAGYICNIPYKKFYVFRLTESRQKEIYLDLKEDMIDTVWCHCGYTGSNADYVEHYKGVNHGWICPKCKRFIQVG